MIIKYNESGKFVGTFYFSIDPQEVSVLFKELCKEKNKKYDFLEVTTKENTPFYEFLEEEVLKQEIMRSGIVTSQIMKVKYFTLYTAKYPIVGIIKVVGIPENYEIDFPNEIKMLTVNKKMLEKRFDEMLLRTEKFNLKETDICDKNCVFNYDLRYVNNGKVINEIKDQEYDTDLDHEIDSTLYIGVKKGDIIILSQDELVVEACITNVYKKEPYNQNMYNLDCFEEFEFTDFNEFKKYYMDLDREYLIKKDFASKVAKYFINMNDIKIPNDICNEYVKEYGNKNNEQLENIEEQIILDVIGRWILTNEEDYPLSELAFRIDYDLKILYMNPIVEDFNNADVLNVLNSSILFDYYE